MADGGPIAQTPYDQVTYHSLPYFETHPDRLRLIGHLFGMAPAPVERCRVLEIGCGAGGNLIPTAELCPESRFLGVDLAGTQIEAGRATVAALDLRNIELRHADLATLSAADGTFDYVIAHGVHSWVPAAVRARLLDVVAELLAPQGIALVSHNVKPGWYPRAMARDLMLWHAGHIADPAERVTQARAFLRFLVVSARPEDERHRTLLQAELEHISAMPDWVVLHDYLADVNEAGSITDFVAELAPRRLQFLGDADLGSMFPAGFAPAVVEALGHLAEDLVAHEQLLDFLRNRAFRMTLVCRAGLPLVRTFGWRRLAAEPGAHLSLDGLEGGDGIFRTLAGRRYQPRGEEARAELRRLAAAWPASLPAAELGAGDELFAALLSGVVSAALTPARSGPPGARPRAPAHARLRAGQGDFVTNLRHENVRLSAEARELLLGLDGSREVPAGAPLDELARKAILFGPERRDH